MNTKATDNETELRSLMTRVMSGPLHPLQDKMDSIEARIAKLEGATGENRVATRQVTEAVSASHIDLRNRLGALLEDMQDGLTERVDPLIVNVAELGRQQQSVIFTLDEARGEASERGKLLSAAVKACDDVVHTSVSRLDDLGMATATANAQRAAMLDASLEHIRELGLAAAMATARHGEALSALLAGQELTTAALAQQHGQSVEMAAAQHAQHTALLDAAMALPGLLAGLRSDLDATVMNRVDAARASILSGTDAQGLERQQGVFAHLKLLKALTVGNLLALVGIAGLAIFQLVGRG